MSMAYAVDAHGEELNVRRLAKALKEVELLILGGDLSFDLNLFKGVGKLAVVTGECDDIYLTKCARKLGILLDGDIMEACGLKIGFIGGLSVHQSIRRLMRRCGGHLDILVTHFPPKGCLDLILDRYHAGLVEVLSIVQRYGVRYVLTGHYHDNVGSCRVGSALVVNPGPLMLGKYLLINCSRGAPDFHMCTL